MLDTALGRTAAVKDLQSRLANVLGATGLSPDAVTVLGCSIGIAAGLAFGLKRTGTSILLLAISAGLDALDGTLARQTRGPSRLGGVLDLTADRVVEVAVMIGIAWSRPGIFFPAFFLVATWYINITVFLAVGAALRHEDAQKLIEYPPGILERSEALIFFTAIATFAFIAPLLCYLFSALEIATAIQRLSFGIRMLRAKSSGANGG